MTFKLLSATNDAESKLNSHLLASGTSFTLPSGNGSLYPVGYNANTTSLGTSTTLNKTGIQAELTALGLGIDDVIKNNTTGYSAVIVSVSTNSVTTSELESGVWGNGDEVSIGGCSIKLQTKDSNGNPTKFEKILVKYVDNANDAVYIESRAQAGTTAQEWTTADYASLVYDEALYNGVKNSVAHLMKKIYDLFHGAITLKGIKTFDSFPILPTSNPTTDYQAIHKKFFLENAGGGGEVKKTLDGSCSANDRVFINSSGNFQKASTAANIQETTLKSVASLTQTWTVKIAANRWVKIYATASQAYAQAGTFDASGNWVGGTEVNFFSGTVSYVSACKQGSDEGVIYVQNNTAAKLFHFTVSDTPSAHTLSIGAAQNGPTGLLAGTSRRRHKIVRLTSTTFACGTFKTGATGFFLGTNTGGTFALSAFHQHSTYSSAHDYPGDICRVDDTHILFASYYADSVGSVRGKVYDVSNQAAPAQSAPASGFYSFGASNNGWATFDEVGVDGDNLVAGWHSYGNEGLWQIVGSAITSKGSWSSPYIASYDHYNEGNGVFKVSDNVWGCTNISSVAFFGWNGTTVDSLGIAGYSTTGTGAVGSEGGAICNIDATSAIAILTSYDTTSKANFLSSEAQTDGNILKGIGCGGILTSETGLTPGENYLIDGVVWGQAVGATEVFITKTV